MSDFSCIEYHDAQSEKSKRKVRSQAARHQWAQDSETRWAGRARTRAARRSASMTYAITLKGGQPDPLPAVYWFERSATAEMNLRGLLGTGCLDPFASFPVPQEAFFPEVIDHYITKMAVDIPEVDGPNHRGLLRTQWFRLIMSEPASFLAVLLVSASHLYSLRHRPNVPSLLLRLKARAIQTINSSLAQVCDKDHSMAPSDALVGAVAKMCSYEAMYGDIESYTAHIRGLQRLLELRGGLASFDQEDLLRKICLWIDMNSAFLHDMPRTFDKRLFTYPNGVIIEPNPSQFIGSID